MFTNRSIRWVAPQTSGIQGERRMSKLSSMAIMALAAVALAGCGGSSTSSLGFGTGSSSGGSGGTTGTGGTGTSTYSMGNGSGSSFQSGAIGISSASVSAGGSTSLQVSVVDQTGTLYTGAAVTITFSSTCISQGLAAVTATGSTQAGTNPDTVTTSTGTATATYTAKGCSGADVITASGTVGSQSLTATGTVTVASAATGSIQFESATPTTIGLKGTGQPSTSTLIYKVLDSTGAPKPGVTVNFALSTTLGGLSLSPASAASAADGTVQTVVSSGTVHTSVIVTATIASPALSTESSQLAVSTGIPASNTFSISVGPVQYGGSTSTNGPACPNVEAYTIDGVVVPINVSLADRYGNPVLDGTAVSFFTDGGKVGPVCNTSGGTGACTVDWTSEDPRPLPTSNEPSTSAAPGRVMVLATALGEESFTDEAETGFYQSGDPFINLGDPYDDANENGQYDQGEYFVKNDVNQTAWQGPPNPAVFVGITCTGTSPSSTCTENELQLGVEHLIIMSTSAVAITCDVPSSCTTAVSVTHGASTEIEYTVMDENGNPPAAGTTITVSASTGAGSITTGSSIIVACSSASPGTGVTYAAVLGAASSAGSGTITIQATSPNGTITAPTIIPVTVN